MANRFDNSEKNTSKDRNTKAYNNMMVYLRELKLHNEKCNDMVEQIYTQSTENSNKIIELQDIQNKIIELQDIQNKIIELQDIQKKTKEAEEINVRVIKKEIAVNNSKLDESLQNQITNLNEKIDKTKKTLLRYMHIIIWIMLAILLVLIIQLLPIF